MTGKKERLSTSLETSGEGKGRGSDRVAPNKHRRVQRAGTGGRRLFDEAAQREFLEYFAGSCNVVWAAREAGFSDKTIYRHRMNDERFREGFGRALSQGYARLEAELLAEALEGGPIPIDGDREAPGRIDRELALTLLREHKRGSGGFSTGSKPKQGRAPRVATNAEVREALETRLRAFSARVLPAGDGASDQG